MFLAKPNGFRNLVGAMKVVIDNGISARKDQREEEKAEQMVPYVIKVPT